MEEKKEQVPVNTPKQKDSQPIYTVEELAEAHKQQFNCQKEVVTAAFLAAGKKTATLVEAKAIIAAFKKKEVK